MTDISKVVWTKNVEKQLAKVPRPIAEKFYAWVTAVRLAGLRAVRQRPDFMMNRYQVLAVAKDLFG